MKKHFIARFLAVCLLLTACSAGASGPEDSQNTMQNSDSPAIEDSLHAEPVLHASGGSELPPEPQLEEETPLTLEAIQTVTFLDVPTSASYADCASYTAYRGLLTGVAEDLFDPEELVSRAAALTVLYRMSGQEAPPYDGSFADVPVDAWYTDAVAWAVQADVIDAGDGGNLGPLEPVTRAQLACMICRFTFYQDDHIYDMDFTTYSDGSCVPADARFSMAWVLEHRFYDGVVTSLLSPNLPVTRAQLARILVSIAAWDEEEPVAQALAVQMSEQIAVSLSQESHDDIQRFIDATASKYGAVGLQVAVVEDGYVMDCFSYGWATKQTDRMTPDHKVRVASISKVAVGISAMLLREEGLIDLDEDIGPYWGIEVRNPSYPNIPITFRSLLTHTSSIRAFEDGARSYSAVKSQLGKSSGYSQIKPGAITSWNYNNYAFGVLGMSLELASERYLDEILEQAFWSMMDIDAAFESGHVEAQDLLVTHYYHGGGVGRSVAAQKNMFRPASPGGSGSAFAGGLTISSRDLAKMASLLVNDGCYEGVQLMDAQSVELMETRCDRQLEDGTYQALSLRSQDNIYGRERLYYHTGSAYGVYNLMSYDPATGDGVVVLSIGASGAKDSRGLYTVCGEISQYIYQLIQ